MSTQARERPIYFDALAAKEVWEGRKTQTRRFLGHDENATGFVCYDRARGLWGWYYNNNPDPTSPWCPNGLIAISGTHCPYGNPGDRLWVKEPFARHPGLTRETVEPRVIPPHIVYSADLLKPGQDTHPCFQLKWSSSRFMKREQSRLLLEVTEVRAERLQDIRLSGCRAEGIPWEGVEASGVLGLAEAEARRRFALQWNGANSCSWDANPWVWVVSFARSPGVRAGGGE